VEWSWKLGPIESAGGVQGEPFPRGIGWLRLFGYGLLVKDRKRHPPLFSERNGYRKFVYVGRVAIGFLKPRPR